MLIQDSVKLPRQKSLARLNAEAPQRPAEVPPEAPAEICQLEEQVDAQAAIIQQAAQDKSQLREELISALTDRWRGLGIHPGDAVEQQLADVNKATATFKAPQPGKYEPPGRSYVRDGLRLRELIQQHHAQLTNDLRILCMRRETNSSLPKRSLQPATA